MNEYHERIVCFHIGRGGRFNNPGHITYVPDVECLQDLFDEGMTIFDEDEEGNKLPVEQHVLFDSGGNEILRGCDIYEKTGVLNLDEEYDTYIVLRLDEMTYEHEKALRRAIKDGSNMTSDDRKLFTEYLAEQAFDKAELLMDEETWEVYGALSEFVDEDNPIDPYSFRIDEQDSNQEARLVKFEFEDIKSSCIVYPDGTVFTLDDWQSGDYPTTMEEVENYEWVDRRWMGTIMLNGLPRTPFGS